MLLASSHTPVLRIVRAFHPSQRCDGTNWAILRGLGWCTQSLRRRFMARCAEKALHLLTRLPFAVNGRLAAAGRGPTKATCQPTADLAGRPTRPRLGRGCDVDLNPQGE